MLGELRQPDPRQQPVDPRIPFRPRHALHRQSEAHVVAHRQPREQRMVLEHHDDAGFGTGHRLAVERDAPGRQRLQAGDQFQQRALPASARTEDRDELSLLHRQVDVLQGGDREPAGRRPHLAEAVTHAVFIGACHHRILRWICTSSAVYHIAGLSHHAHAEQDELGVEHLAPENDHHAEPVLQAHHFGGQHRHPGGEEVDAQHGENLRQDGREDDARPHLRFRGAMAARRLDQTLVDRVHRRDGRDRQDEVDPHEDDEDRGLVADAEQHDAERDRGDRRDRCEPAHDRQHHVGDRARRRDQDTGQDRDHETDGETGEHAQRTRDDGHGDRHRLVAEADPEVAFDRVADERRGRREQRGAAPAGCRRPFPDRHDGDPRREALQDGRAG